jgi:hypothetical protein
MHSIKLLTLELLEKTMGLEKVVLNKLEEVNADLADNAYFCNGTLFIRNASQFNAVDMFRIMNAIKSVVTCDLDLNMSSDVVGQAEYAIDFM